MKKKIATVWLGGCSGCHMSLLDIDERILDIARLADIVRSPIVDGKAFPEVDVTVVEGAVGTEKDLEDILEIRRKSRVVVALGDCAITGNVTALRNFFTAQEVFTRAYVEAESNVPGDLPGEEVPRLLPRAAPLHEYVKVDYFLPGCPPSADLIFDALNELLHDRVPVFDEGRIKNG